MRPSGGERGFAIEPVGETCLVLRFGERIDAALNARVHDAAAALRAAALPGVIDMLPAYATLALTYAPAVWSAGSGAPWRQLADAVRALLASGSPRFASSGASIEIPVTYGGERGPDLDALALHCGLSRDAVIARHTTPTYRVAMLGFAPGFPYLFGLDPALHTPRRATPRVRVPRGSVAIGGSQTGIYPAQLPGGWQLVGQTPLALFDPAREPPALLAPGDQVRFRAIDADEFAALAGRTSW